MQIFLKNSISHYFLIANTAIRPTRATLIKHIMHIINLSVIYAFAKYLTYFIALTDVASSLLRDSSIFIILSFCFYNSIISSEANSSAALSLLIALPKAYLLLSCILKPFSPTIYTLADLKSSFSKSVFPSSSVIKYLLTLI